MSLRRPWVARWGDVAATRPRYVLDWQWPSYLACAGAFIGEHALQAERHGWQPAHLLGARGLAVAWLHLGEHGQWFMPRRIAWERHIALYVVEATPVVRRAWPDGTTTAVFGAARAAVMGRQLAFLAAG